MTSVLKEIFLFPIARHLKPYRSFVFISQSLFNKISYLLLVNTFSFRLNIFLIQGNTKPSKNFENCLFCPENNSGPISILNTHYKFTLSMLGEKIIEECGSRIPNVRNSGRTVRNSNSSHSFDVLIVLEFFFILKV